MLAAICPSEMCGIERRNSVYLPRKPRPTTSVFIPTMAADSMPERPRTEYAVGKLHRETFVAGHSLSAQDSGLVTARNNDTDGDDYFQFISSMYSTYSLEQSRRSRQLAAPLRSHSTRELNEPAPRSSVRSGRELGDCRSSRPRDMMSRPPLPVRKRSAPTNKTIHAINNLHQILATDSDSDASLCRVQTAPARSHRATKSMIATGSRSPRLTIGSMTSHPSSMSSPRTSAKFSSAPCSPSSPSLHTAQMDQVFTQARPRCSPRSPRSPRSVRPQSSKPEPEAISQPLPRSHFSDDSSTEADFVSEFQSSSIAAYLQNEDHRGSIETIAHAKQNEQTSVVDTLEAPDLTPDAGQTCWFSDTEAEDQNVAMMPLRNPRNVIYWSPSVTEDANAGAMSIDSSDKEDWPLPSPYPRADSSRIPSGMGPLANIDTVSQQHKHTLSSETTATATTIVSPTFTEHRHSAGHDSASSFEIPTPVAEHQKPLEEVLQSDSASIAPSEMSLQWTQSPKERLGLGGRMRKSTVVPWELEKSPTATTRRIDTPLLRTKSNRFSAFISRHRTLTG